MASSENVKHEGLKGWWELVKKTASGVADESKKLMRGEDPRKLVHTVKVGLAMAAVSLIYYFDLFHEGYSAGTGLYAMWALNTVAGVFEFSIGATIGKGVNRTVATLLGGAIAVGAHGATDFAGNTAESIMLALIIFFITGAATFGRFIPRLKARNDYFFLMIIVTFGLIAVCTYRGEKLLKTAEKRVETALVGFGTVLLFCFICPCWAGQELHTLVSTNIHTLANFLEGFVGEYFEPSGEEGHELRALMEGYKAVLNSKSLEESLVNFAKWEPRHGKFRYWHPWDEYLKIGALTRECAYKIDALKGYLDFDMQAASGSREKMKQACTEMSWECSKSLRELAQGMETMTRPTRAETHIKNTEDAANHLKQVLLHGDGDDQHCFLDVAVASLLIQIVSCTANIADSVHQLASLSQFKNHNQQQQPQNTDNVAVISLPVNNNNNTNI